MSYRKIFLYIGDHKMYGWRGRIGLIVPSSNTTMEEEFRKVLPDGFSLHTARIRLRKVTREELLKMERGVEEAAYQLLDADVDIIVFGCTTGSLVGGYGYDIKISKMISDISGRKAITTSTAVLNAFKALGLKDLAVATPYIDELNIDEKKFFEANGFKVKEIKGLGIRDNLEIGKQPPYVSYNLARSLDLEDVDGIFISCTNFRTLEIIKPLEEDTGLPVVTSNQATFWYTFKKLGINYKLEKYGRLFTL